MQYRSSAIILSGFVFFCSLASIVTAVEEENRTFPPSSSRTVRDFGAIGDGESDDFTAIQRAVDSRQGDIRFDRGVYRITKTIQIDLDQVGPISIRASGAATILMAGPGPAFRLIGTHKGSADPSTVIPEVWQRQRMPTVDGLEIVGAHAEADGIEASSTMQMIISRVNIRDCRHGIHLVRRNRNVIVSDCHLYNNRGVGLYLNNVDLHQINVVGCHISYNAGGGVVSRAGNVRNLHINGCDIESNMSPNMPSTANVLIDCDDSNNGTAEVAITGCTIQHNTKGPDSANIRFLGGNKPNRRWGHLTIANNIFSDVYYNIDLQHARGATVVGNTFGKAGKYDLHIADSSNIVVGPNALDRNPNYDSQESSARGGVLFSNCQDVTISGLHIGGVRQMPAGIVMENCRRVHMTGCSILDCENAGILLKDISDSRVSECLLKNDLPQKTPWTPLKIEGGSGNVFQE